MILTPHIVVGAAIASRLSGSSLPLALLLASTSHFFLDTLPHWEYTIDALRDRRHSKIFFRDLGKVILDLMFGFSLLIGVWALFKENTGGIKIILLGGFLGALPDAVTFLGWQTENRILLFVNSFHGPIQFTRWGSKKIPRSAGVITELIAIAGGLTLL